MKPVSILFLPEDQDPGVLKAFLEKMLYLVDPGAPVYNPAKIGLTLASHFHHFFSSGQWKSTAARQKRIDLIQFLQSQLQRPDIESFVIIHVDGDRPYAQSAEGTVSQNQQQLDALVTSRLRDGLQARPNLLDRFLVVVPFYSIEAWLYQNTDTALLLYQQHYRAHTHDMARFEAWRQNPEHLDEVEKPKEAVSLGAGFHLELATKGFPAQRVYDVRKSFYKSVERLCACRPLVAALQAASRP
jgi:hypothetical protein